jgi:hypothetical protein
MLTAENVDAELEAVLEAMHEIVGTTSSGAGCVGARVEHYRRRVARPTGTGRGAV